MFHADDDAERSNKHRVLPEQKNIRTTPQRENDIPEHETVADFKKKWLHNSPRLRHRVKTRELVLLAGKTAFWICAFCLPSSALFFMSILIWFLS